MTGGLLGLPTGTTCSWCHLPLSDSACMKSLEPHYMWHMSSRDRNKLMHALCGNTCLVRFCLFLQLFVCCGLHICSPVPPPPCRFVTSSHDQLVSLSISQNRCFDFWHPLSNASWSSHAHSRTTLVCEHVASSCVVSPPDWSAGFDLAPVVISHDPLMLADLPQICLCQKSPSNSVYFSMHDRLLRAGNLSQLGCPQFILSKHVYLPAHVGSSFSFGITLSVPTSTMFDSVLHVLAPVRSLLFLVFCGIVLFICETSCSWFLRVWRTRFRCSQCQACRIVAGCRRRSAYHARRHASSCSRFVAPVVALSFCFVLFAFHLCLLQQQQQAVGNSVFSHQWFLSRKQRNKISHATNGNTMIKCKWESSLESPGVELISSCR